MTEHEPINLEDFADDLTMESGKRAYRSGLSREERLAKAETALSEAKGKEKDTLDLLD